MDFKELGLIAPILKALAAQGYITPSPIQEKAIPPALAGRDVLGCAQTGTGKTCAFAAPILQRLCAAPAKGRPIRALILTPTRELALQIQESFEDYGRGLPLRSAVIFGGVGQAPQVAKLKQGVDILVATPGRLLDLQGQGLVELSKVEIFVLDEADRMLDMGFIHDVRRVLKMLPTRKQTLFFSATMPPEVTSLVNSLLKDPVRVAVDPISSPVEIIVQSVYLVDKGNKTKLLAKLVCDKDVKNALVFTRTKHGANKVADDLMKQGITAAAIHGNKSQTARQQALADFKAGKLKVLVATDIAARGLDIEELSHVFNYNLPEVPETYVHRIGRTGRAGHGGAAVSFCDFSEKPSLKEIEKLIGRRIPVVDGHDWPMAVFEVPVKDARGHAVNAEDAEARTAAKERRRAREAASKNGAQSKKTASPTPVPKREQAAEAAALKKHRPRKKRASATLAEAMTATAPAAKQKSVAPSGDFHRPDPLAGNVVMDATARLLAPRPHPAARPAGAGGTLHTPPVKQAEAKRAHPSARKNPVSEEKNKPSSSPRPHRDRSRRGPPAVELRASSQKDSTEQPSLMKPYYLERD
jgi:ATP-dependent RNA helicase RhlE